MILLRPLTRPACAQCGRLWSTKVSAPRASTRRWLSHTSNRHLGKPSLGKPESVSKGTLPDYPARTRFAPSPTGYLHLGSLRTALYSFLLARATKGQFLLRIEDTDQTRLVPDAEARLYDDLRWCGLEWDEGPDKGGQFGPYRQSERLDIYRAHVDQLLYNGSAFRCFCTKEDLDRQKAETGLKSHSTYPGACLGISHDESAERAARGDTHVVRFKSPPFSKTITDHVYGRYTKGKREDHFIIMKSDGFPTYHLANVVDDHLMNITHVVRGAEWLISTPIHQLLYDAFGWQPPVFAHLGLLFNTNGQKLSKRAGSIDIGHYRHTGDYSPEALTNFVALHGWNPNPPPSQDQKAAELSKPAQTKKPFVGSPEPAAVEDKSLMSMDEMINKFTMRFTKGDIKVDMNKLLAIQRKILNKIISDPARYPEEVATVLRSARQQLSTVQFAAAKAQWENSLKAKPIKAAYDQEGSDIATVLRSARANFEQFAPGKAQGSSTKAPQSKQEESDISAKLSKDESYSPKLVPRVQNLGSKEAGDYILQALQIARHDVQLLSRLIAADRLLFFRLTDEALERSYKELDAQVTALFVDQKPASIAQAMKMLLEIFVAVPTTTTDGEWTESSLQELMNLLGEGRAPRKLSYIRGQSKKNPVPAHHTFLRWAMLELKPGPAMVPLLNLLGREEVLLRLRRAHEVASRFDEGPISRNPSS